jgi:primosomal replication protein N
MARNKIELTGVLMRAPEVRTMPAGMPVLRIEVSCGEARDALRLAVVMAGEGARELGARLEAGSTVTVTGTLREVCGRTRLRSATLGVEVVANEVREIRNRPEEPLGNGGGSDEGGIRNPERIGGTKDGR